MKVGLPPGVAVLRVGVTRVRIWASAGRGRLRQRTIWVAGRRAGDTAWEGAGEECPTALPATLQHALSSSLLLLSRCRLFVFFPLCSFNCSLTCSPWDLHCGVGIYSHDMVGPSSPTRDDTWVPASGRRVLTPRPPGGPSAVVQWRSAEYSFLCYWGRPLSLTHCNSSPLLIPNCPLPPSLASTPPRLAATNLWGLQL